MNAVGIDVSKGKSMVAVMRAFGEVVVTPYEVLHTESELNKLTGFLKKLPGETRIIMEYTGKYYQAIAKVLYDAGFFVSVVHALRIYKYGDDSIRKGKTDKLDAIKIANYGIDRWVSLEKYVPEEEVRKILKAYNRQYGQFMKLKVALKNTLITLLDETFTGINALFKSAPRKSDGHEKWVDFAAKFWHCTCVCSITEHKFKERYQAWCRKAGYQYSQTKAETIYTAAGQCVFTLPNNDAAKLLITQSISQLNSITEALSNIQKEMLALSSQLPEFPAVMGLFGVGETLGPQLMAEIGDVRRFNRKQSLVAFAGVDAPPYQSGIFESQKRSISKRGSPRLRKTLFQVMSTCLQHAPQHEPIFQFLDRKRSEGKHYYVYMTAGCNKFLRIYYGTVKAYLEQLNAAG